MMSENNLPVLLFVMYLILIIEPDDEVRDMEKQFWES